MGLDRLSAVLILATASGAFVQAQATPSAAELAGRIQARYAAVRDFTAQFTLKHTSGLNLGGAEVRGRVTIKKPGRMRWVFETGDQSEYIADGVRMYAYFPKDKLVQQAALPPDDRASTALLLLTGRGDLTRDFVARLAPEQPADEWHLTLKPKTPQDDFTELTLAVERSTLRLRGLRTLDDQGNVRLFRFANLQENRGVSDAVFAFKIPKGVQVRK